MAAYSALPPLPPGKLLIIGLIVVSTKNQKKKKKKTESKRDRILGFEIGVADGERKGSGGRVVVGKGRMAFSECREACGEDADIILLRRSLKHG